VELRHLRYFVGVAEMENVSRAALELHVSQPALSRQIRDLEDELGFALFERTAKSVSLTEAGRVFLKEAREVLQRVDEAIKKARAVAAAGETEQSNLRLHRETRDDAVLTRIPGAYQPRRFCRSRSRQIGEYRCSTGYF
jgi:DNA-binding transcriptional LysR family regulator